MIKKSCEGFTLIELAVILVVVGLMIGVGLRLFGELVKYRTVVVNRHMMDANKEAMVGYAISHLALPSSCDGLLKHTKDYWGTDVECTIADELKNADLCAVKHTNLSATVCRGASCTNLNNVAFVIRSAGIDKRFGTDDDEVRVATLTELQGKADCGRYANRLHIVNNSIPSGYSESKYEAEIYADGGKPPYKWCVEADRSEIDKASIRFNVHVASSCSGGGVTVTDHVSITSDALGEPGTYEFTVLVEDSEESVDRRRFVLIVNPSSSSGGGCPSGAICVYNACGELYLDKRGRQCTDAWPQNDYIVLTKRQKVYHWTATWWGGRRCFREATLRYNKAKFKDRNGDGFVDYICNGNFRDH